MPFGLHNVPAIFQNMINQVLEYLFGFCCIAYMGDILIFSPICGQHTKDVQKLMEALAKACLYLKPSKCNFYKNEVSFLENLILKDGNAICPDKLKAISKWGVPRSTT